MGAIFLSGGGNARQSRLLDKCLVSKLSKNKPILYIPIAMPKEAHSMQECLLWFTKVMNSVGITRIEMLTDLQQAVNLQDYSAVYIGGGNTFYLLKKIRESKFSAPLRRYLKDGGVVYGGSAGAIILGKHIGTACFGGDPDENKVKIKNFNGLNLINGYAIQCHYRKKDDSGISDFCKKRNIKVIALPEETGLEVRKNRIKVIGYKEAYLFGPGKKVLEVNSCL